MLFQSTKSKIKHKESIHSIRSLIQLTLAIVLCLLQSLVVRSTSAANHPVTHLSTNTLKLDASRCATVAAHGKGFTPSTTVTQYANFFAQDLDKTALLTFPAKIAIGVDGEFTTTITLCGLTPTPSEQVTLTIMNGATNYIASQNSLNVFVPDPIVHITPAKIALVAGCATFTLTGEHFIPSGRRTNYAYLDGIHVYSRRPIQRSLLIVNVLGSGNIAYSAQFCGLAPYQQFALIVGDLAGNRDANPLLLQTV